MAKFTDSTGRDWTVELNVTVLKRIRSATDVDLADVIGGDTIGRLAGDPILLCDVLYCVCEDEAAKRGVSDEDFGRLLYGDAIDDATRALMDAIVSFARSPRARAALGRVMQGMRDAEQKAWDEADKRLSDLTTPEAISRAVAQAGGSGNSSGGAQASSV